MRINYVIAAWSGDRRQADLRGYDSDRTCYLRTHLEQLARLQHSLSQVTIVVPHNPEESWLFAEYLEQIPDSISGAAVRVIRRENRGLSYGSWSHAYGASRGEFDYLIFMEDDYIPVLDGFDSTMVEHLRRHDNCGYLCSLVLPRQGRPHAAISNGIASSRALEGVWSQFGELPHYHGDRHYRNESQVTFAWAFLDAGFTLEDFAGDFLVPYQHEHGHLVMYGQPDRPCLIAPYQYHVSGSLEVQP